MSKLSLVVPFYNEEEGISLFFETLTPILQSISIDWEIICVNDGSRDKTWPLLCHEAKTRGPQIVLVDLSRNFGKEAALTAGLDAASGDALIPLDADLQDPPTLIPTLVEKWGEGYEVVLATRRTRDGDTLMKRATAAGFYWVFKKLTGLQVPPNTGDFRLMTRQVYGSVKLLREKNRFMKGLFAWVGYKTAVVHFDRPARAFGTTKFNFSKLFKFAMGGIFSFSEIPLTMWTWLGSFVALGSVLYGLFIFARTLFHGADLPGYASLFTAITFLGGVQLLGLGILGEYLGRVYNEVKNRPIYLVREKRKGDAIIPQE